MRVSVVLCTYSLDRYEDFSEAADSVLAQTHDDVELIVIVDGTDEVYDRVQDDYSSESNVILHCNDLNHGLSYSRNKGAELANGDVVAFLDDDAVADPDWIAELVRAYEHHDVIAAGGKMVPRWLDGEPQFLPAEFYFLVGVTYRGFPTSEGPVRNTFSSNLSFRRDVFLDLNGFKTDMGKQGENNLQGGETELCARMRQEFDEEVWYVPNAEVRHKVFDYRTDPVWLLKRAFWQGYSKRAMRTMLPESSDEETVFLRRLFTEFVPSRLKGLLERPSVPKALQLVSLFAFIASVGAGYLYGSWKW